MYVRTFRLHRPPGFQPTRAVEGGDETNKILIYFSLKTLNKITLKFSRLVFLTPIWQVNLKTSNKEITSVILMLIDIFYMTVQLHGRLHSDWKETQWNMKNNSISKKKYYRFQ